MNFPPSARNQEKRDSGIREMIIDCKDCKSLLTRWELMFIASLLKQTKISRKQEEVLERIWHRVT